MTDDMTKLPYVFDLLYDIKYMYEVESIAKGFPSASDATPEDLVELFERQNMPIPECLEHSPRYRYKLDLVGHRQYAAIVKQLNEAHRRIAELEEELKEYIK